MAYNDDSAMAKLSALNETQESIVTVAQWFMFHRRHADRTGQLWLQRLKDSGSSKRLTLIYLANEITQQSKARRKEDFLITFSPIIIEATSLTYKGATNDVQQKLRRVVEVWRNRSIFEIPIQDAIEARIDELDKSRSSTKRGGGSIFSSTQSSVPAELASLVSAHQISSKLVLSTRTSVNAANQEYQKQTDPSAVPPSAPVHAARLNGLLKTLANAEGAVAESIKARQVLLEGLQRLLDANQTGLAAEESQLAEITTRKTEIDNRKHAVEESIMRGFATNSPNTPSNDASPGTQQSPVTPAPELDRPEVEALTPPGYPQPPAVEPVPEFDLEPAAVALENEPATGNGTAIPGIEQQQAGSDLLSSLSTNYARPQSAASVKKRKLNNTDGDFPDLGGDDGLDDDVAAMLGTA